MPAQLALLGLPRLVVDGRTVPVAWARRALALLTYLFASRGAQARDEVAFALWPDEDEEAARANLRRNLNLLRTLLPSSVAAWIVAESGSVEFRHADAETDVGAFEEALAARRLAQAVQIYGGDFAAPLDDAWVVIERERLRASFHAALSELVGSEFSARRFDAALVHARRIAVDEPLREDITRRIIAIRYAMGDRPGALMEYERFARSLRAEMNIDPMPETVWLRDLVLRGEPLPSAPDAAFSRSPASRPAAIALLPFTGRRNALERLQHGWDAACAGRGTVVFVRGEAGIGKTRLIAEFLEQIVGSGGRVLRGTTASPEARPYEALLAALGGAAPFVPSLDLEAVWLAALAPLVPELAARVPGSALRAAALPAEREVTRFYEACVRFVRAVARPRPVVLVLEDLHWAGAGSADALQHIAGRLSGSAIFLIATYRSGENQRVESLERTLNGNRHAETISLARLRSDETRALLAAADLPITGAAAADIAQRSEGHPLFLSELIRDNPAACGTVPGGITELVELRLARCSVEARSLARIAAVCGATFDLDLLGRVAGWDEDALIDRLAELLARQFIRSTAMHERGSYTFSHALVHAAVLGAVEGGEQRQLHRLVARVLEARDESDNDVEIAQHWRAAGESQRAAQAYLRAARRSLTAYAYEEAADFASIGLDLTDALSTRATLLELRIAANLRRAKPERLRADVRLLTELAGERADTRFAAALYTFQIEEISGDPAERQAALEALFAFADDSVVPLRAAQVVHAAARHAMENADFARALGFADDAVRRYSACGASADEFRAVILCARVRSRCGQLVRAQADIAAIEPRVIALNQASLSMDYWLARANIAATRRDSAAELHAAKELEILASAAGDHLMLGHAAAVAGNGHLHASAIGAALSAFVRSEEIYGSIGAEQQRVQARSNRGAMLLQIGRLNESAELLGEQYAAAGAMGATNAVYFAAIGLGCAKLVLGEIAAATALLHEALALAGAMKSDAYAALALGDLGAAEVAGGDSVGGLAHLLAAARINGELGRHAVHAHDLARAAGAEPDPARGASYARKALAIVEAEPDGLALAPEIYARCALAFERAGDASAASYSRSCGRAILEMRMAKLNEFDREYHGALPWHRALLVPELASTAAKAEHTKCASRSSVSNIAG